MAANTTTPTNDLWKLTTNNPLGRTEPTLTPATNGPDIVTQWSLISFSARPYENTTSSTNFIFSIPTTDVNWGTSDPYFLRYRDANISYIDIPYYNGATVRGYALTAGHMYSTSLHGTLTANPLTTASNITNISFNGFTELIYYDEEEEYTTSLRIQAANSALPTSYPTNLDSIGNPFSFSASGSFYVPDDQIQYYLFPFFELNVTSGSAMDANDDRLIQRSLQFTIYDYGSLNLADSGA